MKAANLDAQQSINTFATWLPQCAIDAPSIYFFASEATESHSCRNPNSKRSSGGTDREARQSDPLPRHEKCARLGVTDFARAEIFFDTHQKTGEHHGGTSQLPVQTVPCTETARKTKRGKRKQTPAKQSTGITPQDPPDEASAGPGHVPMEHRQRVFACPCDEGLCKRPSKSALTRRPDPRT